MKHLGEIAIRAFNGGSDKTPNEKPTGEILELVYSEMTKGWHMSIKLEEGTAGIGFYLTSNDRKLNVMSGHIVFSVDITSDIQNELLHAPSVKI
jgi:hypothetical protein